MSDEEKETTERDNKKRHKKTKQSIMDFIDRQSFSKILLFINRYDIIVEYNNPQKRKNAMKQSLYHYWSLITLCQKNQEECAICYETISFDTCVATECAHLFCDICVLPYIRKTDSCPLCRSQCSYIDIWNQVTKERLQDIKRVIVPKKRIEENEHANEIHNDDEHIVNTSVITCATIIKIMFYCLVMQYMMVAFLYYTAFEHFSSHKI